MQPARIKPHAKEHTNNPVQRPRFTLGGMQVPWLELESTNPGSPPGQPGARERPSVRTFSLV
jgi:hypothetical protein